MRVVESAELRRLLRDTMLPEEEPGKLPGAGVARLVEQASIVWTYLHRAERETPAEVIGAFDDICERLGIPYVFNLENREGL